MGVDGLRLDAVPVPVRARGHELREPARDARVPARSCARHVDEQLSETACCWPRRTSGRRTPSPTSATATSATWPSTSRSCRGCSWRCTWRTASRSSTSSTQTPAIPENCQWALFLRNHDELTLEMVTDEERDYMYRVYAARPAGADQPGHPPPAGAAARQRPPQDRADERAAVLAAGHAGHLLRRRDRHGRQHLPRRPQRRAHADAVERRPQRRLLARQPAAAVPAGRSSTPSTTTRRSTSRRSRTTRTRCCGG